MNKHLINIICLYINYELPYIDELSYKIFSIKTDVNDWRYYNTYLIKYSDIYNENIGKKIDFGNYAFKIHRIYDGIWSIV